MRRIWSIVDFVIVGLNLIITFDLLFEQSVIFLRCIEAFLVIFMFFKSLYYLRLISEIAPLINDIFAILKDIRYFILVYVLTIIAFILSFYIIGQNQTDLLEDGEDGPSYSTMFGSFKHVYMASLGGGDTSDYFGHPMQPFTLALFMMMSFFMSMHLLNMLIGIMGRSFSMNLEIAEPKKKMSQLEFVVDNWHINPIKRPENIVFIVAAFTINDTQEVEDKIDQLDEKMLRLFENQDNIVSEVQNIHQMLQVI